MLIDDSEAVDGLMARLRTMQVKIAIDDFGTRHSSLSYLKRFTVDTLKIDRSFVCGTPHDAENCAIATAVVALGHGLRLKVVAEGVETHSQAEFLRGLGCDELQGYLLSPPLDPLQFAAWLAAEEHGGGRMKPGKTLRSPVGAASGSISVGNAANHAAEILGACTGGQQSELRNPFGDQA